MKHISNITKDDIDKLKEDIVDDETTECSYDETNMVLKVKCLEENDLTRTEWRIKVLESTYNNVQLKEQVKYPDYW